MRSTRDSRVHFILVLIILLYPQIGNGQQSNNQRKLHYQSGYFATPIEIPGGVYHRKIDSFEFVVDAWDRKEGGRGLLVVTDGPMKFNEFGDATPLDGASIQEHPVSLVDVTPKVSDESRANPLINRRIFKLDFDEAFCDRDLFLNVPKDRNNPIRLLICNVGKPKSFKQVGPSIESMFRLTQIKKQSDAPEDEPTRNIVSFSTSTVKLGGRFVPGLEIRANLGGTGSILLDKNRHGIHDFGDGGFQTHLGFFPISTRFIENSISDPKKMGRRLFELTGQHRPLPKLTEAWETVEIEYSIVVAAKSSGDHRLVVKRDGKISNVISLQDTGWRRYVHDLERIENERTKSALRKLRRLYGNECYVGVVGGDIRLLRLGPKFSDEAIKDAAELSELTELILIEGGPEFIGTSFEELGKLKKLESLTIRNSLASDRLLEVVGDLPRLRELSIVPALGSSISDQGVASLANSVNLERLILHGSRLTNKCLVSLENLNQLKVLKLTATEVTVAKVAGWRQKNPACRISIVNYKEPQTRNIQISSDVPLLLHTGMRVDISGELTQSDYESLARLKTIEKISLPKSANLDNLKAVLAVDSLRSIMFERNDNVTNEFIKEISLLRNELSELHLASCKNVDRGCVQYLKSMSKLERLSIGSPKFDQQTLRELMKAIPNCKIQYH